MYIIDDIRPSSYSQDAPRFRVPQESQQILRVLLLEDSAADAELVRQELDRAGLKVITKRVDSQDAFTRALEDFAPDVVLADHCLAQFDAVAALQVVRAARPDRKSTRLNSSH